MFSPGYGTDSFQGHDSRMSSSPSSPVHSLTMPPGHSSPFLPGYLLGDHHSQHYTVQSSPRLWSSGTGPSSGQKAGQSGLLSSAQSGPGSFRKDLAKSKVGGPPIKSLYSSPPSLETSQMNLSTSLIHPTGTPGHGRTQSSPTLRQMLASTPAPPVTGLFHTPTTPRGETNLQALNQSQVLPVSPAQTDPFYTQEDLKSSDVLDETWVTVFGFPPAATSFILQQFSQYGTILKHVVAGSQCNWMHIHYMSKIQAKKALSKDGKIFGGCLKIGVTPCIEKLEKLDEDQQRRGKRIMEESKNMSMSHILDSSIKSPSDPDTKLTPIRPLTAAYLASKGEYEVLRDKPTPQRDASLVSKLKEYMFGY